MTHPRPGTCPTAGNLLSQMMTLCPARPPLATQDELRALLQRFSRPGASLSHDACFYTTADLLERIGQAIHAHGMAPPQTGELYVGVQRLSRIVDRLPRHGMLQGVRPVCLYGIDDLHQARARSEFSHPHLLTLALDRVLRTDLEWFRFVVLNASDLQMALVAQQVEGDLGSDAEPPSLYRGLWTCDPVRVQQIVDILRQAARCCLP